MKIFAFVMAVIEVIVGLVFLGFAGQAETSFVSLRLIVGIPLVVCNVVVLGVLVWEFVTSIFKWRNSCSRYHAVMLGGLVVCDFLVGLGRHFENGLIEETKARGDQIQGLIEDFTAKNGKAPKSLGELIANGYSVPEPALKGSRFSYGPGHSLSFDSVAFTVCYKREKWLCGD